MRPTASLRRSRWSSSSIRERIEVLAYLLTVITRAARATIASWQREDLLVRDDLMPCETREMTKVNRLLRTDCKPGNRDFRTSCGSRPAELAVRVSGITCLLLSQR